MKSPLEMIHRILPSMIKNKQLIQQISKVLTVVDIYYNNGITNLLIEKTMVNYKIFLNQRKQTVQQETLVPLV